MEFDSQEHNKNKELLKNLKLKQNEYQSELDNSLQEQKIKNQELIKTNLNIQTYKEKLEDMLKSDDVDGDNEIGTELLIRDCNNVIAKFIHEIPKERHSAKNLLFRIEYSKNVYTWKIEDDSMTFQKLKQEIRHQLSKTSNEFYFTDESNNIFLDEMKVKHALFPLSSTLILGYEPTIKVVDKKIQSKNLPIEVNKTEIKENGLLNEKGKKDVFSARVKNYVYSNFFILFQILIYSVFLATWISSIFNFRYADEYRILIKPFQNTNYVTKLDVIFLFFIFSMINFWKVLKLIWPHYLISLQNKK